MLELINFCFNSDDTEFIGIFRYGATWTSSRPKCRLSFNKTSLKFVINYLPDNCYFALASMCFRQLIEFTMVPDPDFLQTCGKHISVFL